MDIDFLLIRKMKSGDEEAMDTFVRKYYPTVLRYCQYYTSYREQAEDITQETFIRFFRAIANYQHIGKAINYLYTIARNLCIDYGKLGYEVPLSVIKEPEENYLKNIDVKLDIEQALQKLPNEMREVIILHYFQDLTLREVSELLGIGLPLTKYRIKKAKEQLRELLGKEESI